LEVGHFAETGGEGGEGYAEESRGEGGGEGDDLCVTGLRVSASLTLT
jgi:hypothetical protein